MGSEEAQLITRALLVLPQANPVMDTRPWEANKQESLGVLLGERMEHVYDQTLDFAEFQTIMRNYATDLQRLLTCRALSPGPGELLPLGLDTAQTVLTVVFGRFLSHSRQNYTSSNHSFETCLIDNWVRDIIVRFDEKGINIPKDYLSTTGSRGWELADLSFLTDEVGFNEADRQGHTLLHLAILSGNSAMTQELLELGADPSPKPTPNGHTLFHYVAARGDEESYRQLRLHEQTISSEEIPGLDGFLPLHYAVLQCHLSVVKAILAQHSENPEYINEETTVSGITALGLAISHRYENKQRSQENEMVMFWPNAQESTFKSTVQRKGRYFMR
ncbi:ankyrin-2 ankyrin [Colletotrichum incanum]|uniref:Ankyrin-2 ankyrin n=1 Tax=Colletotrichum incanum TaxID=1573173 RepID=A0A166RRZ2_COLIC|nr:ankyrin-2 ankyrin [Colletotrichum incanum]